MPIIPRACQFACSVARSEDGSKTDVRGLVQHCAVAISSPKYMVPVTSER